MLQYNNPIYFDGNRTFYFNLRHIFIGNKKDYYYYIYSVKTIYIVLRFIL